jgi:two-component system CheB/CheR fusion protein
MTANYAMGTGPADKVETPMSRNAFQRRRVHTGSLSAGQPAQPSIATVYQPTIGVNDGEFAVGQRKTVDDQIGIFNGLLKTVSAKLLVKIKELDRANGDLQNLMQVSAIPAIFVDENLVVRRFTPESSELYSLSSRDIGRSLLDVTCDLNYCDLEDDFRCVEKTGKTVARNLKQLSSEAHYLMRILPTPCRDGSFGGATITFVRVNA